MTRSLSSVVFLCVYFASFFVSILFLRAQRSCFVFLSREKAPNTIRKAPVVSIASTLCLFCARLTSISSG
uniref:Uncharacterized protein n=1 Tax=Caenorhabditis japonica TaxID=281687 RepID=A0A8R1EPU6_CAEJA